MAAPNAKQRGVTGPVSTALPTETENEATNALIEELRRQGNYESTAETNKRSAVLASLQSITEEFVKQVSRKQGKPESFANAAGGKISTYGSFRLGVFGPGSDIDTLVVVPENVSQQDYFDDFPDLLLKMAPQGSITDLTPVRDAYVPIIKFEYSGISIDLIFCSLERVQVPKDLDLTPKSILNGLDDVAVRCLNGTRVTDEILDLVPQPSVFRTALRGVKLWAQRRAIYANIMGFPGGVAWAMLVARICQLYPKATSSTVILKFFRIMESWAWPMPIQLKITDNEPGDRPMRVWNPQTYKADSYHIMPIITPAYPSMCATHNVTRSTMAIIQRELKRGGKITDQILLGKAPWKDLFVKHTFFTHGYKYYLSVISASTTPEAQLIWSGLVESKVRLLVVSLEGHDSIALAHPFNKGFERVHKCKNEEEIEKVKGGSHEYLTKDTPPATEMAKKEEEATKNGEEVAKNGEDVMKNGDQPASESPTTVYTTTFYIGLELHEGAKSLDISFHVQDFRRICCNWDKYDAELNALSVIHTRNFDLPNDVFTEGEVKPTKATKRVGANGAAKKRGATEDSTPVPAKRQQTSVK